jgi:acyl carrier protein
MNIPGHRVAEAIFQALAPWSEQPLTEASRFGEDISLDSVQLMELLMSLEDHFDVTIPMNAVGDVETVGDLCMLVTRLLMAQGSGA